MRKCNKPGEGSDDLNPSAGYVPPGVTPVSRLSRGCPARQPLPYFFTPPSCAPQDDPTRLRTTATKPRNPFSNLTQPDDPTRNKMLDVIDFITERGGNPELIRESQRRRFESVEVVDEVIALWEDHRKVKRAVLGPCAGVRGLGGMC